MNDRLKEIAKLALSKSYEACEGAGHVVGKNDNLFVGLVMGHLAEMIINECIRIDIENPDAAPGVEIAEYFRVE